MQIELSKDPPGGDSALPQAKDANRSLNHYSLLLAPGLLGCLFAYIAYPPLDRGLLVTFGLCALFFPLVMQVRSLARKRLRENAGQLRAAFVASSLALAALAGMLLLNGTLDRSPRIAIKTTVTRKILTRGSSANRYVLTVSSWRAGRSEEDFTVDSGTFGRASIGRAVTVELHRGFFGLPWSGSVLPE